MMKVMPTRGIMPESNLIDSLVTCENERFIACDYRGREDAGEFDLVEGSIPVMVSAPHAVTHWRDGRTKPSDDYTGSIALALAELTGAHAIVATRFSHADPNWDPFEASAYKQALAAYIREHDVRVLLDIHGMVAASPNLVAIGTADGETCRAWPEVELLAFQTLFEGLADASERYGKSVALNPPCHGARGRNTVARALARECGIATMQVELATQVRVPSLRGTHVPKGDPAPFKGTAMAAEISVRLNPDPEAVESCVLALAEVVAQSTALLS